MRQRVRLQWIFIVVLALVVTGAAVYFLLPDPDVVPLQIVCKLPDSVRVGEEFGIDVDVKNVSKYWVNILRVRFTDEFLQAVEVLGYRQSPEEELRTDQFVKDNAQTIVVHAMKEWGTQGFEVRLRAKKRGKFVVGMRGELRREDPSSLEIFGIELFNDPKISVEWLVDASQAEGRLVLEVTD
ncbi:MAG: hypothetical protein O7H41_15380 [Planctomycetota bacterium]|nr:hypothetical protein [Planctomycetota bacterium]